MSYVMVRSMSPAQKRWRRRLLLLLPLVALLSLGLAWLAGDLSRCCSSPKDPGDFAAAVFVAVACGCFGWFFHTLQRFLDDAQARGTYREAYYASWFDMIAVVGDGAGGLLLAFTAYRFFRFVAG